MADKPADRPAPEIEITPEMIEAGEKAYYFWDNGEDPAAWIVHDIYTEMERVRRRTMEASSVRSVSCASAQKT